MNQAYVSCKNMDSTFKNKYTLEYHIYLATKYFYTIGMVEESIHIQEKYNTSTLQSFCNNNLGGADPLHC